MEKGGLILFLSNLVFIVIENNLHTPIEFTSEKWNQDIWQRERMIDSLNSKYDFVSMKYDQIIELLGENGVSEDSGKDKMIYYTGKGTFIQPFLMIQFDEDGNVTETMVNSVNHEKSLFKWIANKIVLFMTK